MSTEDFAKVEAAFFAGLARIETGEKSALERVAASTTEPAALTAAALAVDSITSRLRVDVYRTYYRQLEHLKNQHQGKWNNGKK